MRFCLVNGTELGLRSAVGTLFRPMVWEIFSYQIPLSSETFTSGLGQVLGLAPLL